MLMAGVTEELHAMLEHNERNVKDAAAAAAAAAVNANGGNVNGGGDERGAYGQTVSGGGGGGGGGAQLYPREALASARSCIARLTCELRAETYVDRALQDSGAASIVQARAAAAAAQAAAAESSRGLSASAAGGDCSTGASTSAFEWASGGHGGAQGPGPGAGSGLGSYDLPLFEAPRMWTGDGPSEVGGSEIGYRAGAGRGHGAAGCTAATAVLSSVACCGGVRDWRGGTPLMKSGSSSGRRNVHNPRGNSFGGGGGGGLSSLSRRLVLLAAGVFLVLGLQYGAVWGARRVSGGRPGTLYDEGE
jgi:hypothetical protein